MSSAVLILDIVNDKKIKNYYKIPPRSQDMLHHFSALLSSPFIIVLITPESVLISLKDKKVLQCMSLGLILFVCPKPNTGGIQ